MTTERTEWTMPEWMEPCRDMFRNTGGNSVESLLNDTETNGFNNAVRSALIVSVESQVGLLYTLRKRGLLVEPLTGRHSSDHVPPQPGDLGGDDA